MPGLIVIGGGTNGLVAAGYLAKAGLKPLVLERREILGGAAITEELRPGFRCPTLSHATGPLLPKIVRDLQLERHGLILIKSEVRVFAPNGDGPGLTIYEDASRTAREMEALSPVDARSYFQFHSSFNRIGRMLAPILSMTPPSLDSPSTNDLLRLVKIGKDFRGLKKEDAYRLLRWAPMAVADLAAEWFETELLRSTVAARGIYGSFAGPWSAGTSAGLLVQAAIDGQVFPAAEFVKGGMGALTTSLAQAATAAGAEIKTSAKVAKILVKDGRVRGVVLSDGQEISAETVVSNADPRHTLLQLINPIDLAPEFLTKIRNYRSLGSAAKINLALAGLPHFLKAGRSKANGDGTRLSGRIHIGPEIDYLERAFDAAKYGDFSPQPYMDITIPSITDPSLAPAGKHVMSIHVQYTPYTLNQGDWDVRREELGDRVVNNLSEYAPNLSELILDRQILTPVDLEETFGLSGGHIHHGELSLDQLFTFRPIVGWAQYRTPVHGLYLCGAGTHPGGSVTGASGANASRQVIRDLRS